MQIHELNNFSGTLGSGAYLAIDDGNDTGKISSQGLLAATEARIDNIIAGPAPSAEEIVDARLGDDGVTYPSLGDAIRDQFSDVKSAINYIVGDDVRINMGTWIDGEYIDRNNGNAVSYGGWHRTDYIEIPTFSNVIHFTNTSNQSQTYNKFYDSSKNAIGNSFDTNNSLVTVPNGAKYFRLSLPSANLVTGTMVIEPLIDKANQFDLSSSVISAVNAISGGSYYFRPLMEQGGYTPNTTVKFDSTKYIRTIGAIPIDSTKNLTLITNSSSAYYRVTTLDKNFNILNVYGRYTNASKTFTPDQLTDAHYFIWSIEDYNGADITPSTYSLEVRQKFAVGEIPIIKEANSANIDTIMSRFDSSAINKSISFESGRYQSGTGEAEANASWNRSTEPILVDSKYQLEIEQSGTSGNESLLYEYDSYMGFVKQTTITEITSIALQASTCYVAYCVNIADATGVAVNFKQNYDGVPEYFKAQLASKEADVIDNMNDVGRNGTTFIFITDPHWDSNYRNSPALVGHVLENANIDNVFCGGDVINEGTKATMYKWFIECVKAFQFPLSNMFFPIARGNHDDNSNWSTAEEVSTYEFDYNTVYNLMMNQVKNRVTMLTDTEFSFYFDEVGSKTRFVFVDTQRTGQYIPHNQIIQLLKTVPSGWHVVFILHKLMRTSTTLFQGADVLAHIVKAYNDRTSGSYIGVRYDFTAGAVGTVEFIIGGHMHADMSLNANDANNPSGVPIICTDTDSYRDHSGTEGTVNSQCFDVVTCDYTNKTVKCVRIGRGNDRTFSY